MVYDYASIGLGLAGGRVLVTNMAAQASTLPAPVVQGTRAAAVAPQRGSVQAASLAAEFDDSALYVGAHRTRLIASAEEQATDLAAQWSARSGWKPAKVSVAVNLTTGQSYSGYSSSKNLPETIHPELQERMPASSLEAWPEVANCAEFKACNAALLDGATMDDLAVHTVYLNGESAPRCLNCQQSITGPIITSE